MFNRVCSLLYEYKSQVTKVTQLRYLTTTELNDRNAVQPHLFLAFRDYVPVKSKIYF